MNEQPSNSNFCFLSLDNIRNIHVFTTLFKVRNDWTVTIVGMLTYEWSLITQEDCKQDCNEPPLHQRFVSSTVNLEVLLLHLRLIVYFQSTYIFLFFSQFYMKQPFNGQLISKFLFGISQKMNEKVQLKSNRFVMGEH